MQGDANRRPGRYNSTYEPSGKGTYNCRWKKEERRNAAVARQKALCKADPGDEFSKPLDWKMMLRKGDRDDTDRDNG